MNSLLIVLAVLAVHWRHATAADCLPGVLHSENPDTSNICKLRDNWSMVPHPHNCRKFYVCANYNPEEHQCEENYYFDTRTSMCVFGDCDDLTQCQQWVRPVSDNCTAFEIREENGVYHREDCMPGYFFHPGLGLCMLAHDSELDFLCSCHLEDYALIPNTGDCRSFYMCLRKRPQLIACPDGHYFNKQLATCLIDLTGVCSATTPMTPEETAVLQTCERMRSNGAAAIFHADERACDKFYICIGNRVVTKQCPAGFYFDQQSNYCQLDTVGACAEMREKEKKEQEKNLLHKHTDHAQAKPVKISVSLSHIPAGLEKKKEDPHEHGLKHQHQQQAVLDELKAQHSEQHQNEKKHAAEANEVHHKHDHIKQEEASQNPAASPMETGHHPAQHNVQQLPVEATAQEHHKHGSLAPLKETEQHAQGAQDKHEHQPSAHQTSQPEHNKSPHTLSEHPAKPANHFMLNLSLLKPLLMQAAEKHDKNVVLITPEQAKPQHNQEGQADKVESPITESGHLAQAPLDQHAANPLEQGPSPVLAENMAQSIDNMQTLLKLPENPKYDKLSSKFMSV